MLRIQTVRRYLRGHLAAAEFIDILEGIPLAGRTTAHLEGCDNCQDSLASIRECFEDLSQPSEIDLSLARFDSAGLRSGVRDQLLARAVKKSSIVPRWTGHMLTPRAAWALSLALIVAVLAGTVWHYRTFEEPAAVAGMAAASGPVDDDLALFVDDSSELETEALAWSETELFVELNQLEESEEETLRELIALTFEDGNGV
jgi:hypothetical protein